MRRRLRREFQKLEAQFDPGAQAREWRALIDKALYNKGPGPQSIREQLRLHERLQTLHARRDRYNKKRYNKKRENLIRLFDQRHAKAAIAIRSGFVTASDGSILRKRMSGALTADRRLTIKLLHELEGIHEALFPDLQPWEIDQQRIRWEKQATITSLSERSGFEEKLKPIPFPLANYTPINLGFEIPIPDQNDVPNRQSNPTTSRAAS